MAAAAGAVTASAVAPAAQAATLPGVLVIKVNGESSAPEASLLSAAGYQVTSDTPAQLAAMTQGTFDSYAAVVIGDSSSGSSCAGAPSTSTLGAQWEPWVSGNVAVLGTAPELAAMNAANGQTGADQVVTGAAEFAAAGYDQSEQSGTGLYVSLNCGYKSSAVGTAVPLLTGVPGLSADPITVQGGFTCTDSGTVNQWGTGSAGTFSGFTSSDLAAGVSGSWPSPGCPVQEAFDSWPANFTVAAFDPSSNSDATANFTASDGVTGQPYLLLGSPAPSTSTLDLTPATGGQVVVGAYGTDGNAADAGLAQATAGDPVDTETGDFTQDETDLSIPTFGPALEFDRSYDAQGAQEQEETATPGPLGYGWTDNWASSLSTSSPIPGDIYALDGLAGAANTGEGLTAYAANELAPASSALGAPGGVLYAGGNEYITDTQGNRVLEIPGSTGTQWGVPMPVAGVAYTIAGSYTGQVGLWGPLSGQATSALLWHPAGLAMDSSGDLIIADAGGAQVDKVTPAGVISTLAGNGSAGLGNDAVPATSSALNNPVSVAVDGVGDIYIADTGNNRIQEIAKSAGSQWGQTMAAGDIYTVAGSAAGTGGLAGGAAWNGALLRAPGSITADSAGDLYIADTGNNQIRFVPKTAGTYWGQTRAAGDIYDLAGSSVGTAGDSGNGGAGTAALLSAPASVTLDNSGNMDIADTGNNQVQFMPKTAGTYWGQVMAADDIYDLAGSSAGTAGSSGNGGAGTAALLNGPATTGLDSAGDLYIADAGNNQVRKLTNSTQVISLSAGDGQDLASAGDGGPAVNGQLVKPGGEIADSHGDLYVTDSLNNRVQEIAAYSHNQWGIPMTGGDVYTIAGSATGVAGNSGDNSAATAALLNDPQGLAFDNNGDLLIADFGNNQVRMLAVGGTAYGQARTANDIYTIAGQASGASGTGGDAGPASGSSLYNPYGLAVDSIGDVYIADKANNRIQEIFATGGHNWGQSMTANDIYTVAGPKASGASGDSGDGAIATSALLDAPQGLATDAAGDLFIADTANEQVREVPIASGGLHYGQKMTADDIYTLAGSTSGTPGYGGDDGPATDSLLHTPIGLALDPAGDIYIADGDNYRIREIANTAGIQWANLMNANDIYTVAGNGTATGLPGNGGPASMATVYYAVSNGTDSYGDLYIGDQSGGQLREITSATPATIHPAPGLTSALYPAPGSTINGTAYPGGITVIQPGGAQVTFYPPTSGSCAPLATTGNYCVQQQFETATLAATTSDGITTYTFSPSPGSDTYTYSGALGTLTKITDPLGNTVTVAGNYPAPGAATSTTGGTWPATSTAITCPATVAGLATTSCQTIISASSRALVIGSNGSGQVTSVTDPLGREWTYGYTGSDLTSATDPMGNSTTYTYDGANPAPLLDADMLTITNPNAQPGYSGPDADLGADTINVYDASGRVVKQTDPMGNVTTFNYCPISAPGGCLNAATGNGTVESTTGGNATIDSYDQGVLAAVSQWTGGISAGTPPEETDETPDTSLDGTAAADTLLNTNTTDGDANVTAYQYGVGGNQTQSTSPSGGSTPSGTETSTSGYPAVSTQNAADLELDNCDSTAEAVASCVQGSTLPYAPGPPPVSPGGVITPPPSAPPLGITWTLYDTDGNQIYTTSSVYSPTGSYEYSQTTYQLYKNNSVTLAGTAITCTYSPPTDSLPCATINADGVVTQLAYDAQGDLTCSSTPDGNSGGQVAATTYVNDADGEQVTRVAPDGNNSCTTPGSTAGNYTTTTAYNSDGEQTSVAQGNGTGYTDTPRVSQYGYDGDGDKTSVIDARGYTTSTSYNADDEATLVTNPDNDASLTCYDSEGNVTETVPPAGVAANSLTSASCPPQPDYPADYSPQTSPPLAADATLMAYDGDGDEIAMYTPDPAGQTSPAYQTTTYSYDGDGNLVTTIGPPTVNGGANQITVDTYNTAGQLAAQTTGYGSSAVSTVSYCYNPDGDKSAVAYGDGNAAPGSGVTYANGKVTGLATCSTSSPWAVSNGPQASDQATYTYDSADELVASTTPANTASTTPATTSSYDPAGNMLTQTDPNGVTTTWTFTPLDQVATVSYSGSAAHPVSYTYDASGNQTGMTDATGTSSAVYDSFGELTSAENGASQTTGYGYSADGQLTGITYPLPSAATWASSDTVTYGYDRADALTSVTDFNGHQISIGNTADGLPNTVGLGSSGDTIATTYDPTDSPSAITLKNSSSTLQSFTYSNSPAGTILAETDTPSSSNSPADFTYDARGRVTSMTPGTGAAKDYAFDASGDLTSLPTGATGTYNDAGELTSSGLSGTTTSYTYNADGEQLSSSQGSTSDSSGTWTGAGQLATFNDSAANMTAASYDGNGLRASTTITPSGKSAISQTYVWNGDNLLMDGANAYIYTSGTAPAEQVNLTSGAITYLIADSLGSVRGSVTSAGVLSGTTGYDAWGEPETAGGLTGTTPFGFAGGYTDPDGLIYLINRYYQPSTGQFISVDPDLADTLQPYAYTAGNPVSDTDPTGLHCDPQPSCDPTSLTGGIYVLWDHRPGHKRVYVGQSTQIKRRIKKSMEERGMPGGRVAARILSTNQDALDGAEQIMIELMRQYAKRYGYKLLNARNEISPSNPNLDKMLRAGKEAVKEYGGINTGDDDPLDTPAGAEYDNPISIADAFAAYEIGGHKCDGAECSE